MMCEDLLSGMMLSYPSRFVQFDPQNRCEKLRHIVMVSYGVKTQPGYLSSTDFYCIGKKGKHQDVVNDGLIRKEEKRVKYN